MNMRWTRHTEAVCRVLLEHHPNPVWGYQIMRETGLASGTVYPLLERLHRMGWVHGRYERTLPRGAGRPTRRYFTLTDRGLAYIRKKIDL